jgi:hypothetical protein
MHHMVAVDTPTAQTVPLLTYVFGLGIVSCLFAFVLIVITSLFGTYQARRSYVVWVASIQNRERQSVGVQAVTKNRLVREVAKEVRSCRHRSTFWYAAFGTFTLCHLCVTGGTALTALKEYAPMIMAGAGAVGVVATVGNGVFKPRVLAQQYLARAEKLATMRREAEAEWDAISHDGNDAPKKRQAVIAKLITSLKEGH